MSTAQEPRGQFAPFTETYSLSPLRATLISQGICRRGSVRVLGVVALQRLWYSRGIAESFELNPSLPRSDVLLWRLLIALVEISAALLVFL